MMSWDDIKGNLEYQLLVLHGKMLDVGYKIEDQAEKQWDMLTCDPETDGKKQGYNRAAKEYTYAYRSIKKEFNVAKEVFEEHRANLDCETERFINLQEDLEIKRKKLEKEVERKAEEVSHTSGVALSSVKSAIKSGGILPTSSAIAGGALAANPLVAGVCCAPSLLEIICAAKKRKMAKYEQIGYEEAKELYEKKIDKLKEELEILKEKASGEELRMSNLIDRIMSQIIQDRTTIAELKIIMKDWGL